MRKWLLVVLGLLVLSCNPYLEHESGAPLRWTTLPVPICSKIDDSRVNTALSAWTGYFDRVDCKSAFVIIRWEESICSFRGAVDVMGLTTYEAVKAIPYFHRSRVELCPDVGKYFLPVLVHELGHVLGLGHSVWSGSIMYPTAHTTQWEPSQRDYDNLRRLYHE